MIVENLPQTQTYQKHSILTLIQTKPLKDFYQRNSDNFVYSGYYNPWTEIETRGRFNYIV